MTNLLEQFKNLKLSRFEIVLQSQSEAVLPALIGSTLRGAFGHALKAVSCSVEHQNCEKCFLSDACLYTTIFEPTSPKLKDLPRPFIFEPPIPPLTREISENQTLKLSVAAKGKISFGLTLIGEAAKKLPYFIYAFELMARHGLGASRQSFAVYEVFHIGVNNCKTSIYTPNLPKVLPFQENTLADFVSFRLNQLEANASLKIELQTPLRILRKDEYGKKYLVENINFGNFFYQCSWRTSLLFQNYGKPLQYDHQTLKTEAESVKTISANLWRHDSKRYSNRQGEKLDLDGMLGEIEFEHAENKEFLPFIVAGEFLLTGSASVFGLGKYEVIF
jgi:CRISPR-associated endoribonuclease Cas6